MSEKIMERLRVYIGWTVPVGLLLRKLTYAEAQAATPFIVAVALWAAYLTRLGPYFGGCVLGRLPVP